MGDPGEAAKAALLRTAEQALEQRSYPEVVKCCKQVLKQDRGSYGAYVLLAKALQGTNHFPQAQVAFRKALETDKSALPAWLGLMDLYEAAGEIEKVIEACNAVKQITLKSGDKEHYLLCMEKLASTYAKSERHAQALEIWQEILKVPDTLTPKIQVEALCGVADSEAALLSLAMQQEGVMHAGANDTELLTVVTLRKRLEASLKLTVQHSGLHVEHHNELLLNLYLQAARESKGKAAQLQLLEQAVAMTLSSNLAAAFEVALIFCEEDDAESLFQFVNGAEDHQKGASYYKSRLGLRFAHLFPSHGLALSTIACLSRSSANRKKILCEKALRLDDTCATGWQLLAEMQAEEGPYSSAVESVQWGLQAVISWRLKYGLQLLTKELLFHLILGQTHLATQNYGEAVSVFQFVLEAAQRLVRRESQTLTSAALEGRVKVALAQGDLKVAEEKLEALLSLDDQNHWALAEQGWLAFQKGSLEISLPLLEQAVEICGNNSTYRRRLGLVYWETGQRSGKERAVVQLVEAARLDPREAGVFRYLGHYYHDIAGDIRRAARSYQKAITLDPEDAEAGEALCNLLEQGGQLVLEGAICREAAQHSPRAYWAWRRLGFIQVQAKQWSESVANLQHALRGYTSDGCLWEALGLAYQQLGMLTAALKAYDRVVALGNISPVFALLQSGTILLSLASYQQAIDMFQIAIDKVPEHVVALCGLAAALLGRARECTSIGALAWAATLIEEAAEVAGRCTTTNGTVAAGWKLLGDIEVAYSQILPCEVMEATVKPIKCKESRTQSTAYLLKKADAWHQQRLSASKRARCAYLHLLHICPQQGSVYADLAIAMELVHSLEQNRTENHSAWSSPEKAVLSGLSMDPTDADLWFVFGVLSQHKVLKQHAFIQALQLDAYHASTWAHLGQLYLCEEDQELARQAFDRARSADPTLSLPWAGMALVHSLSDTKREQEEAFASCLYAVHLSPVVQVQLGLTKLAQHTKHLHMPQVYAAIEQSVQRAPLNVEVLNLKGLVCEARGSHAAAISAFQFAQCVQEQKPKDSASVKQSTMISLNLGRVFCKDGRSEEAIHEYEKLAGSGILLEEPEALRSYAVAAWQAEKRELAAAIAKQAVELSRDPAALSLYCKMMYWLSGPMPVIEEIRRTSLELFQIMNFSFTALSLAVAADHQQSVTGILSRCNLLFEHEEGPRAHILLAAGKQGKQVEGHIYSDSAESLLKALHSFPDSHSIRSKLGQELTESSYGRRSNLALRCCNVPVPVTAEQGPLCTSLVAAVMACSACGAAKSSLFFSTCHCHANAAHSVLPQVVRWVHTEPWNRNAQSSLVLTLQQVQQPSGVYNAINRLTSMQLLGGPQHPNMSLLLRICASDAALQCGDTAVALQKAKAACSPNASSECQFVANFQLIRCYLATQNLPLLQVEIRRCRKNVKPDDILGLLKLSELEDLVGLRREAQISDFEHAIQLKGVGDGKLWTSLWHLGIAQGLLRAGDYISAEKASAQSLASYPECSTLHLFHGAICLALANFGGYTEHLKSAVRSLSKASQGGTSAIPIAGVLLSQAVNTISTSRNRAPEKWEQAIRSAWTGWPAESRPGELYYQMGLLAEQFKDPLVDGRHAPEALLSKKSWTQKAVHLNPACFRYWTSLRGR